VEIPCHTEIEVFGPDDPNRRKIGLYPINKEIYALVYKAYHSGDSVLKHLAEDIQKQGVCITDNQLSILKNMGDLDE